MIREKIKLYTPGATQKEFLSLSKRIEQIERRDLGELLRDARRTLEKADNDIYHLLGVGAEYGRSLHRIYKLLSKDKIRKIHTGPCDWDKEDSDLACELCQARIEACIL